MCQWPFIPLSTAGATLTCTRSSVRGCHYRPGTNECIVPCVAAWTGEGHDPNASVLSGVSGVRVQTLLGGKGANCLVGKVQTA